METNKKDRSLLIIIVVLSVLIVIIIGFLIIILKNKNKSNSDNKNQIQTNINNPTNIPTNQQSNTSQSELVWRQGPNGYEKMGEAPACEEPLLINSPVTLSNVTSILYPGQTRGGNYKTHGGFRFDNNKTNIESIVIPMDGYIVNGVRFLAEGEVQYGFDFINPCGIMYRMGHLRELTPKFQAIADQFPEATADSRVTNINPLVKVTEGEEIATKTGIITTQNTFLDFGVYDLRQKNEASQDPSYTEKSQNNSLAPFAICWLNNLGTQSEYIKSLPAGDPGSGKNSDYCK